MLGVMGCSDNETDAQKLSKNAGDAGPANPDSKKLIKPDLPPPKTQKEWMDRQPDQKKVQMGPNQSGARR